MSQPLYKSADNLIAVQGLRSAFSGILVPTATITAEVFAEDGVSSMVGPVTLTGSSGSFSAALSGDDLEVGSFYFLEVLIEASGVNDRRWIKCKCVHHQEVP